MKIILLMLILLGSGFRPVLSQNYERHYILFGTAIGGMLTNEAYFPWTLYGYKYNLNSRLSVGVRLSIGGMKGSSDIVYNQNINYKVIGTDINYAVIKTKNFEFYNGFEAGYHAGGPLKYQISFNKLKSIKDPIIYEKLYSEDFFKGYFFITPHTGMRYFVFGSFGLFTEASYIPYYLSTGIITRF